MTAEREAEILKLLNNAYLNNGPKDIWETLRALSDTRAELDALRAERDGLREEEALTYLTHLKG